MATVWSMYLRARATARALGAWAAISSAAMPVTVTAAPGDKRGERRDRGHVDVGAAGDVGACLAPDGEIAVGALFGADSGLFQVGQSGAHAVAAVAGEGRQQVDAVLVRCGGAVYSGERLDGCLHGNGTERADANHAPQAHLVVLWLQDFPLAGAQLGVHLPEGLVGLVEASEGLVGVVVGQTDLLVPSHGSDWPVDQHYRPGGDPSLERRSDVLAAAPPLGTVRHEHLYLPPHSRLSSRAESARQPVTLGVVDVVKDRHEVDVAGGGCLTVGHRPEQQHLRGPRRRQLVGSAAGLASRRGRCCSCRHDPTIHPPAPRAVAATTTHQRGAGQWPHRNFGRGVAAAGRGKSHGLGHRLLCLRA